MKYFLMPFRIVVAYLKQFWFRRIKGLPDITYDEMHNRLELCLTCPNRLGHECGVCGCTLIRKARLGSNDCPLSIWSRAVEIQKLCENSEISEEEAEDRIYDLYWTKED